VTDKPIVLLIDDDPDFIEATCAVLESASYEVWVAYNGEQGLTRARKARPDLIILDVIMPVEDGFQTLEALRADPVLAGIPVLILTSLSNGLSLIPPGEITIAAENYIDKPMKPLELLQRIEKLLGKEPGT